MFNYLAFIHYGIKEAREDAYSDGCELASKCFTQLNDLDNPEQFPAKLMILLVSPAYCPRERAQALLDGIQSTCREYVGSEIPLIGSSVVATFFDRRVYPNGALLICLASHLLEAEVAFGKDARSNPEGAVNSMLEELKLNFSVRSSDPNPMVNSLLFTFFPTFGDPGAEPWYPGPDLHWALRKQMRARVPIVGGGSSTGDRTRAGLQFAGRLVLVDAIVAAKLTTGFPFTSSIGNGLTPTENIYHAKELASDKRTILQFEEGLPAEVLGLKDSDNFKLLGELSLDGDPLITVARTVPDKPGAVQTLRKLHTNSSLKLLLPEKDRMRREAAQLVDWSLRRFRVENPVGVIGIHCKAWLKYGPETSDLIGDVRKIAGIEERNYIGGFFDGEIGMGQPGHSLFGNWCLSRICFGDELRERTPFFSGFDAMAKLSQDLARVKTLEEAIKHSLELIRRTGYPGAMFSSLMLNQDENWKEIWLVPTHAEGSRFKKILDRKNQAKRKVTEHDLFAKIWKKEVDSLILDTQAHPGEEFAAYKDLHICSQYIKPLRNFRGKSLAFLQIDLGDLRYKKQLQVEERRVIESLSVVVEATLTRLINRIESEIAYKLDAALLECMRLPSISEALRHYIEKATKIFRADMGHIRLARYEDRSLVLAAGIGEFYEVQRQLRENISIDDDLPTAVAFRNNRGVVINDVPHSRLFKRLLDMYGKDSHITKALEKVGSYANYVFSDERGKPIGTINLMAKNPWFFTRPLVSSLKVMGHRISLLIEHYRQQYHQQFLSQISTVYEYTENFDEPLATLRDATRRCREAANADMACLYLWDNATRKFVLYAQDGWDERWVKAARYSEEDQWTGQIALQEGPMYIPDVYQFKVRYGISLHPYSRLMFGRPFSDAFHVEALALPLTRKLHVKNRSAGTSQAEARYVPPLNDHNYKAPELTAGHSEDLKKLGAFVLYRRRDPERAGMGEGFTVTDPAVLKEAADNLAIMVNGQLRREVWNWKLDDNKRRNRVRGILSNADKKRPLEEVVCREMLLSCNASQIFFYFPNKGESLSWAGGFEAVSLYAKRTEVKAVEERKADDFVSQAARDKRINTEKFVIPAHGYLNPEVAKMEGRLKRLCLPLVSRKKLIGVLDIHWDEELMPQRSIINKQFGQEIADIYNQQKKMVARRDIKRQKDRNLLATQTMGIMLFQSTHRVMNLVQELRAMPGLIAAAATNEDRETLLKDLSKLINSATDRIQQPMQVARRTRNIEPSNNNLKFLISRVLGQVRTLSPIEVRLNVDEKISVWADPHLVEEAFVNIIQNAFRAMSDGGTLDIKASLIHRQKTAAVTFSDTGVGMTAEEREAALMGFGSRRESTGMGVLASVLLITANNGKLGLDSEPGRGTRVIVTLPVEREEETL
jgi:signal transduction histidine kinase